MQTRARTLRAGEGRSKLVSDATSTSMRRRRFRCGVALFVLGLAAPALIPLVSTADLPVSWKTVISGLLAIGDLICDPAAAV